MHTKQGHYAPCCVNGHMFSVTGMTHPFVTFHEKIPTLLVPVGVRGLTHKPQQWAFRHKAIHAL